MSIMPHDPFASILIVTAGRKKELVECLASIAACKAPFNLEVIIILNGDDADVARSGFAEHTVIRCHRTTPAAARNIGLKLAKGRFVCFIDDDVTLPSSYFNDFWKAYLACPDLDVIGGPDRTVECAGLLERSIGHALRSPLATAKTRHRHKLIHRSGDSRALSCDERKLILCNLWVRNDLFSKDGHRFDERFMRNEENVLLFGLKGRQVRYDPTLFVYHRRKTHLARFARAVFQSGYFRARSFSLYPGSVSVEFFVPSVFIAYLLSLPLALPLALPLTSAWHYLIPLGFYAMINSTFAFWLGFASRDIRSIPLIVIYQFMINTIYGAGFLTGFVSEILRCASKLLGQPGKTTSRVRS